MRYLLPLICVLPGLCLLPGCASLSTELPNVSPDLLAQEQSYQEKQIFAETARHQERLSRVAYNILSANTDLCKKSAPDIGAITHTLKSYSKELRPAAKRELGAGTEPKILYVRAGSPAEELGLQHGDILRGPNGKALSAPSKKLSHLLENGLTIARNSGDESLNIFFSAPKQCAYPVKLKMSSAINAYANGKTIVVTAGMMKFAKTDDELALIVGHELAHNEMGHIPKIISNYLLSLGATRYTRPFESEADYVGLYYVARAGYNMENIEDIWRRLAEISARPVARAKTHPTYPDRYVRLAAARAEIKTKQEKGTPLTPNLKDGS